MFHAMDHRVFRFAQIGRTFNQHIQHRLQISWRAADDLEDIGGRGLLLERLFGLVEQACVFNGDHRLIGKGLEHRGLALGEQPGLRSAHGDRADGRISQ